jgi:diguanylate cyclase (GGDEF)-like protein
MILTLIAVITIFSFSVRTLNEYHNQNIYEAELNQKKAYIKETVLNQITKIEGYISEYSNGYFNTADFYIQTVLEDSPDLIELEDFMDNLMTVIPNLYMIQIYENNILLYNPNLSEIRLQDLSSTAELSQFNIYPYATYQIVVGVYQEEIDKLVFDRIKTDVLEANYELHTYMWINQILYYDGGDGYAIRFIHPNSDPVSGTILSTNTEIYGKKPYEEELEGIKAYGEVYFTYHFKLPNSDELAEKITYAKHYPRYNFIIAMGVYFEDINTISQTSNYDTSIFSIQVSLIFLGLFLLIFAVNVAISYRINRVKEHTMKETMLQESNRDELTNAYLRRVAIRHFDTFHSKVLKNPEITTGFALFDIDNFKTINDTYGHKIGDVILKEIVKIIQKSPINDNIYRWGGDEFIVIFEAKTMDQSYKTIESIAKDISSKTFVDIDAIKITISVGLTSIKTMDISIDDAVSRADKVMYEAKNKGRNQVRVCVL